jgi:hypothetical protein
MNSSRSRKSLGSLVAADVMGALSIIDEECTDSRQFDLIHVKKFSATQRRDRILLNDDVRQ